MLTSLYFFDFRTKKPLLLSLSIRLFGNAFMYANRILRLVLTNFYDIIKIHNLRKDGRRICMLKCKYRREMTLWKTKI